MKKTAVVVVICFIALTSLFAADYAYSSYGTTVEVGRDAVHKVEEDFVAVFHVPHHGIYRFIPYRYENVRAKIKQVKCSDVYSLDRENGNLIIKIGSENRTYTGEKPYSLGYDYDCGADINDGYDLFYFNLLGTDNDCPTENFDFEIKLPSEDLQLEDFKVYITCGGYGSESEIPYRIGKTDGFYTISGSLNFLKPYEGVTALIVLPDGWYQGARVMKDLRNLFTQLAWILPLVLMVVAYIVWNAYGSDDVPIITARFEAPSDFSPLFTGYIVDEEVNDRDITSMLFYWADKGYMKITEPKKKKYEFVKLKDLPNTVPAVERKLFYGLFNHCDADGTVRVSDLVKNKFYETAVAVKSELPKYFIGDRKIKDTKSILLSILFTVISAFPVFLFGLSQTATELLAGNFVVFFFFGFFFAIVNRITFYNAVKKWHYRRNNFFAVVKALIPFAFFSMFFTGIAREILEIEGKAFYLIVYSLISSAVLTFEATVIVKYTEYGKKIKEEVLGFREFIEMVSMPQLITMIDEDPEYYYHVLGYAIALGLEKEWAKKFESITVVPPAWYSGIRPFDIYFLSALTSDMYRSVKVASVPADNTKRAMGSLGGGGGFSGGGFGGGGSRAW